MRVLLDTHAFLFAIGEPRRLSAKLRELLLDASVERWVSVVSLWEIAIKVNAGKLAMPLQAAYYVRQLEALNARTLPVTVRHTLAMFALPVHHRDPFDRLLIAQAREEELVTATRDAAFSSYGIPCIW